ncbi:MAG: GntR family transcriptional regulator [Marinicaulis sp.]|nr:GntR family transcriptional regulator [Marinicaulis sp.]
MPRLVYAMKENNIHVSQVEGCYDELRRLIVTCAFAPGDKLNEKALMERLGYGRTPVREALLRLDHDRLIETRQRSGYIVRSLTRKSIADLLTTWRGVVPMVVSLSTQRMSEKVRAKLLAQVQKSGKAAKGDPFKTSSVTRQFFGTLIEIIDNEPLDYIYRHLAADLERVSILLFRLPHGREWVDSLKIVHEILEEKDPLKAAAIAHNRVTQSSQALLDFLDAHPQPELYLPYFQSRD